MLGEEKGGIASKCKILSTIGQKGSGTKYIKIEHYSPMSMAVDFGTPPCAENVKRFFKK